MWCHISSHRRVSPCWLSGSAFAPRVKTPSRMQTGQTIGPSFVLSLTVDQCCGVDFFKCCLYNHLLAHILDATLTVLIAPTTNRSAKAESPHIEARTAFCSVLQCERWRHHPIGGVARAGSPHIEARTALRAGLASRRENCRKAPKRLRPCGTYKTRFVQESNRGRHTKTLTHSVSQYI